MCRGVRVAVLLALLAQVVEGIEVIESENDQDKSESYMVLVQRSWSKAMCAGSAVSARAVLTSASCARPPPAPAMPAPALWARAALSLRASAADLVRRVRSVALSLDSDPNTQPWLNDSWHAAVGDLALLELDESFGQSARVRPVQLAREAADCDLAGVWYVTSVGGGGGGGGPLSVATLSLASGPRCGDGMRNWDAIQNHAVCLRGGTLCQEDQGSGVVCEAGKLFGVISRSVWEHGSGAAGCGDVHAAQYLVQWGNFLDCAYSEHSCGRNECANVCIERDLLQPGDPAPAAGEAAFPAGAATHPRPTHPTPLLRRPTRPHPAPLASPLPPQPRPTPLPLDNLAHVTVMPLRRNAQNSRTRTSIEFDPSRVDDKVGEYGENVADYVMEESPTRSTPPRPPLPSRTAPTPAAPASTDTEPTPLMLPSAQHIPLADDPVDTSISNVVVAKDSAIKTQYHFVIIISVLLPM